MIWTGERKALAIASLEGWRSVRHRDHMASKEHGIDCIHLVYEILIDSGLLPRRRLPRYSTAEGMGQESDQLKRSLLRSLWAQEMPPESVSFGDIAVFKTGGVAGHCGFATETTIWHSLARRCVTESALKTWAGKIDCCIRLTREGFRNGAPEID